MFWHDVGEGLKVAEELAAVVAIGIAILLYKRSEALLTRERRLDFELGLLRDLASYVEQAYARPVVETQICVRLLGYDDFPRLTALVSSDDATEDAIRELTDARVRDIRAGEPSSNDWTRRYGETKETYQQAARAEVDAAIGQRLEGRLTRPWWRPVKAGRTPRS